MKNALTAKTITEKDFHEIADRLDELESSLLKVYRQQVELALEITKTRTEGEVISIIFYQGSADLIIEFVINNWKTELSFIERIIPQKTCYCVPERPIAGGHPLSSRETNRESMFRVLGGNLERWKSAYKAFKPITKKQGERNEK